MRWSKKGIIWSHPTDLGISSHAMLPTPYLLDEKTLRIFYTSLDSQGRGLPFYVDVDPVSPRKILGYSRLSLMSLGDSGCFDDCGVVFTSVVKDDGGRLIAYYAGFEKCINVRYRIFTGIAISIDNGNSFDRISKVPALDRVDNEIYFRCGPFCLRENGLYKLYYVAGDKWIQSSSHKHLPVYEVKFLTSEDGLTWRGSGTLILPINPSVEHGFGRPWVLKKNSGEYEMFYSIRKITVESYRMGIAFSYDGINWIRKDQDLNLDVGMKNVDENAIMYAAPIEIGNSTFCFYNGDNFGQRGIAFAELVE